jgi:hypothetical protein
MKRISLLLFFLLLAGCSKKSPGPTTYSIQNNSSNTLYGFTSYYYDGSNFKELSEHGDLAPGASTDYVTTDYDAIDFYFSYDPQGVLFYSSQSFTLNLHVKNLLEVNDNTSVDGGTTYYVLNQSDFDLINVISFYFSNSQILDEVDHGDLSTGTRSEVVSTDRSEIYVEFQLQAGGDLYVVNDPYPISDGNLNSLAVTNSTQITNLSTGKIVNGKDLIAGEIRLQDRAK